MSPKEICERLGKIGVPNLWIPSADSFLEVEAIPILGSGKTDLKAVSDLAKCHFNRC
jgi:acyl-[acyl-carrier-protein]-phospholipid O-acyltransferase/long-chain-fatty-acid--[acyl-carrier-protein] ligase